MNTLLYLILGVIAILILWIIFSYNGLIRRKMRADEAWSDIDVQLKRRYDLIPNLMETVKGYMQHERGTLEAVIQARNSAMTIHDSKGHNMEDQVKAENVLSGMLRQVFALAEAYPDLKANQNFAQLQDELSDTENKIQASRRFYNGNVRDFNIAIATFPTNLIAGAFTFKAYEFFELKDEAQRENVKVAF